MSAHYALQQAVYAHLMGDSTLMGLVSGIYDRVTEGAAYPYVLFGEGEVRTESLSGMEIETVTLALHVHSRAHGRGEADAVIERLVALLHNNMSLSVSGYHLARLQMTQREVVSGKDLRSFEAELRIEAVLSDA